MATHYRLVFRGAIQADQHAAVVRPRLQTMLKASDAQMDVMFSGQPVTLKKAVDEATAERYLDAFTKAGAKLELAQVAAPAAPHKQPVAPAEQPVAPSEQPAASAQPASIASESSSAFGLAEVGADLISASERPPEVAASVTTSHLTLASPGTTLADSDGEGANAPAPVDTSHLQLDQPGVQLGVPAPEVTDADLGFNFDFELGEVGEVLGESRPEVDPQLPDLSHLELETQPAD